MELQEVVDEEGRLELVRSLVAMLYFLAANRAFDKAIGSLNFHGEAVQTIVAKGVETRQCPGLSVTVQADRTGQLLIELLQSIANDGRRHR